MLLSSDSCGCGVSTVRWDQTANYYSAIRNAGLRLHRIEHLVGSWAQYVTVRDALEVVRVVVCIYGCPSKVSARVNLQ